MNELHLDVLGSAVTVEGDHLDEIADLLADLSVPDHCGRAVRVQTFRTHADDWEVRSDGRVLCRSPIQEDLSGGLVHALNHLALDHDDQRLHVHAAVVEINGTGVVLCGPSGSGKSTLTAELVRRGHAYITDEMVALHSTARTVQGLAKPIGLKGWAADRYARSAGNDSARVNVRASTLGLTGRAAVPGMVVFPRFRSGAAPPPLRLPSAEAILLLAGQLFDGGRFGPVMLDSLAAVVAHSTCWQLDYDDVDAAASTIEALAGNEAPPDDWMASWHRTDAGRTLWIDGSALEVDADVSAVHARPEPSHGPMPGPLPAADLDPDPELVAAAVHASSIGPLVVAGGLIDAADAVHAPAVRRPTWVLSTGNPTVPGCECRAHLVEGRPDADPLHASAVPVRLGHEEVLGLHPRHRFLDLALSIDESDAGDALMTDFVAAAQLPPAALDAALDEAERWGVNDRVIAAVVRTASRHEGIPPTLRMAVDRLSAAQTLPGRVGR